MLAFIAKRIVNYVILTIVATTLGYLLASSTLNPASRFLGRNPAVPQGTIDASLQKLGATRAPRCSSAPGTGGPGSSRTVPSASVPAAPR